MSRIKKTISVLLSLIIVLSAFTTIPFVSAGALDGIGFVDEDGEEQTADGVTAITSGSAALNAGWYAVTADTEINSRITCTGDVNLILCNDTTLTAHKGITVSGEDNSLTIYQQAEAENVKTGKLIIDQVDDGFAGIGGTGRSASNSGNNITINGGTVTATGGQDAAGIGGGHSGSGENITINGGNVSANGGQAAAGIGGGLYATEYSDVADTVTINGGTVNATGGIDAAGIGGGYSCDGVVTINGGKVTATSIGKGTDGSQGSVTLSYTNGSDSICAGSYNGTVTLEKDFDVESTIIPAGTVDDNRILANKMLYPSGLVYLDENGAELRLVEDYTVITSSTTALSTGWYVMNNSIAGVSRLTVSGSVKLFLSNEADVGVFGGIIVDEGNSLTIFAQPEEENKETGKLYTTGIDSAGIGSEYKKNCGTITINGGIITSTGCDNSA